MNKTARNILIIVGALIIIVIVWKMLKGPKEDGLRVTTEKAQLRTIIETVNASGKVYPEVEVKISPDIAGEVTELLVQEGDSVKRGQILARIYADIYSSERDRARATVTQSQATVANSQAGIEALKAQLDQAKVTLDRNRDLYNQKVISQAEFDQFSTNYRSAQSQYNAALQNIRSLQANTQSARTGLEMANKNLGRTTLIAPMDGVISSLTVKKGERVAGNNFNVGTEMMRVADMSTMEVRVDVGENDIVKVSIGDSADVSVEAYNNRKFKGVVTQIAASTNKTGTASVTSASDVTNYEVRIRLAPESYNDLFDPRNPRKFPFRPGMNASADIMTKRKDGVVSVPISSVGTRLKGSEKTLDDQKTEKKKTTGEQPDDQNTGNVSESEEVVFVVDKDNKVAKRVVTTGIQDISYFEVLSGLKAGDQIVTAPYDAINKTLKTGDKVTIVTKDQLFGNK